MRTEFMLGVLVAVVILFAIRITRRKAGKEGHFDEMQLRLRARGYGIAYLVTVIGLLLLTFLFQSEAFSVIEPAFGVFLVLMISIATFAVYCVWNEAFFHVGQRTNYYMILCLIVVLLNGASAAVHFMNGTFLENGRLTFDNSSYLVSGLTFLSVLIALLLKKAGFGKGEEE